MRLMTLKHFSRDNQNCLKNFVEIYVYKERLRGALKLKENKDIAITNARKIVDARNYIVHGYDSLSVDILWSIVVNHLPRLKNEVEKLLQE